MKTISPDQLKQGQAAAEDIVESLGYKLIWEVDPSTLSAKEQASLKKLEATPFDQLIDI